MGYSCENKAAVLILRYIRHICLPQESYVPCNPVKFFNQSSLSDKILS